MSESQVNEKLPLKRLFPLGLQHVLAMYAGALAVPMIIGGAIGLNPKQLSYLIAADLFTCGIATTMQSFGIGKHAGIKLPVILGCSFAAVGPMVQIGVAAGGGANGLMTIFGATIAAGIFIYLISPIFGKLTKFFPPVVTGTVITVIGLSLIPVAVTNVAGGFGNPAFGSPKNIAIGFFTLLVVLLCNRFFKGFMQAVSVLMGLLAGTVLAGILGMLNFSEVGNSGWFAIIQPFYYGFPKFEINSIILICIVSIITTIEALGTFLGLSQICEHELDNADIVRGIRAEGLSKIMGGAFNCFPYATFSQNVGLVALSGVRSRFVTVMAGVILIFLGLVPKFAALATVIPMPVLGGATLAMFGMVAVAGIRILFNVDLSQVGNMIIVAVSIGVGLGFNGAQNVIAQLPQILQTLLGDGIISASILAIMLNIFFNYRSLATETLHVPTEEHII